MIASDGECTANGYTPQVRLELMYPDGLQYYRPTKKFKWKEMMKMNRMNKEEEEEEKKATE